MSIDFYIVKDWRNGNTLFKSRTLEEAGDFYFSKDDDEQHNLVIVGVDKNGKLMIMYV